MKMHTSLPCGSELPLWAAVSVAMRVHEEMQMEVHENNGSRAVGRKRARVCVMCIITGQRSWLVGHTTRHLAFALVWQPCLSPSPSGYIHVLLPRRDSTAPLPPVPPFKTFTRHAHEITHAERLSTMECGDMLESLLADRGPSSGLAS